VFVLKVLARELILPPTSLLLLILIGAPLVWRQRHIGWAFFAVGFASMWLLCTPVVADHLTRLAEGYPALNPDEPADAQAVVVIGGGGQRDYAPEYRGPMADPILLERLTLAAYLTRRYSLPLAVSGAKTESFTMAQTLIRNFAVTPRWIEGNSRDTYENAQLSARILFPDGVRKIILVTSSAHEWRAVQEFKGAGFEVLPAPAGVWSRREYGVFQYLPSATGLQRSYSSVYELIGEPMRRLLAAGGVREKLDRRAGT
jgi:uncharacterized SAM-binding protein YcdF (DUF218 family)